MSVLLAWSSWERIYAGKDRKGDWKDMAGGTSDSRVSTQDFHVISDNVIGVSSASDRAAVTGDACKCFPVVMMNAYGV